MESDLLPDEIRRFSLTIASNDFPKLLSGRNYTIFTNELPLKVETLDLPPAKFSRRCRYAWHTNDADCSICTDDSHEQVIIVFSAE